MQNQLTVIDLFCGLGGLSQGFTKAGYQVLFANDIEKEQVETFSLNHPDTIVSTKDIRHLTSTEILEETKLQAGQLDVLLGGPPCQGFSTYGRRKADDPRNQLFREFARIVRGIQPKAFVMENVTGMLSIADGAVVREIMRLFIEDLGYATTLMVLDAVNYGVPQFRRRIFFVGQRNGHQPTFPLPTHKSPKEVGHYKTVNTASSVNTQLSFFSEITHNTIVIRSQDELERYLLQHDNSLLPAATVHDAISDLPSKALLPRETKQTMPYPIVERTIYQKRMKGECFELTNHAAKRHMIRRMIRTALIDQGDYGKVIRSRLTQRGVPKSVTEHILAGNFTEEELKTIRNIDKEIEGQLLAMLRSGEIEEENVKTNIRSGGFSNKYRRLHWEEPSHTLVAHMARDCSDFIHPELNRPISVREAARLQSFPDSFQFGSSQFRQLRGIGNAVPPILGEAIARHLACELNELSDSPSDAVELQRV